MSDSAENAGRGYNSLHGYDSGTLPLGGILEIPEYGVNAGVDTNNEGKPMNLAISFSADSNNASTVPNMRDVSQVKAEPIAEGNSAASRAYLPTPIGVGLASIATRHHRPTSSSSSTFLPLPLFSQFRRSICERICMYHPCIRHIKAAVKPLNAIINHHQGRKSKNKRHRLVRIGGDIKSDTLAPSASYDTSKY